MSRKPKLRYIITLYGNAGETLFSQDLSEYELPEKSVLALSLRYFDDPEPCEIHRSAVHQCAMLDLAAFCRAKPSVSLAELTEEQRDFFPAGTRAIRIEEQAL